MLRFVMPILNVAYLHRVELKRIRLQSGLDYNYFIIDIRGSPTYRKVSYQVFDIISN